MIIVLLVKDSFHANVSHDPKKNQRHPRKLIAGVMACTYYRWDCVMLKVLFTYAHVHICLRIYIYIHSYMYIHLYMYTCIFVYTYLCVQAYMHIHT